MKALLRRTLIGLGAAGFTLAALTVLTFNRSAFGWQALSVPTGSMRPAMQPGSLVLTHRVPISSLKVGDVITHTNPLSARTTITHRIVKIYKANGRIPVFVTKGDANPSADPAVVGGMVKGKMAWHVPHVGTLLMWAKTWTGIAVLVYLPALVVMIHETRLLAAYLRKMKPYRLGGWAQPQPGNPLPSMQVKWAMGAAAVVVAALAVTGLRTVVVRASQPPSQTLLVLSSNTITANPAPASSLSSSSASAPTSTSAPPPVVTPPAPTTPSPEPTTTQPTTSRPAGTDHPLGPHDGHEENNNNQTSG